MSGGSNSSPGQSAAKACETVDIYGLFDPRNGALRYVGLSYNAQERFKGHMRDARKKKLHLYNWVRQLFSQNLVPTLRVFTTVSDALADETERKFIALARKLHSDLLNIAIGGRQPHPASREVMVANGYRNARAIHDDPMRKRIWALKRQMGQALKQGYVSERTKEKLRYAARKRPDLFGAWANI